MMFMGSIVNGLTIIGGSLLGLILHNISANAKDTITKVWVWVPLRLAFKWRCRPKALL